MPRCTTSPPAATTAAGITSPRSTMAEAANTRIGSQPALLHRLDRAAHGAGVVRDGQCLGERAAAAPQAGPGITTRFSSTLVLVLDSLVRIRPARLALNGATATRPPSAVTTARGDDRLGHRERDHLHGRQHLAGLDALERRHGRHGQRFVDAVERVQRRDVELGDAGRLRVEVAAPRERRGDAHASAGDRARDDSGGIVLRHVVVAQPRGDHGSKPASRSFAMCSAVSGRPFLMMPARVCSECARIAPSAWSRENVANFMMPQNTRSGAIAQRTAACSEAIAVQYALTRYCTLPTRRPSKATRQFLQARQVVAGPHLADVGGQLAGPLGQRRVAVVAHQRVEPDEAAARRAQPAGGGPDAFAAVSGRGRR